MLPPQLIRTGQNLYKTLQAGVASAIAQVAERGGDGEAVELQSLVVEGHREQPSLVHELHMELPLERPVRGGYFLSARTPHRLEPSVIELQAQAPQAPERLHRSASMCPADGSVEVHPRDRRPGDTERRSSAEEWALDWPPSLDTDSLLSSTPSAVSSALGTAESAAGRAETHAGVATPTASSEPLAPSGLLPWATAAGMPPPRRTTSDADDAPCIICYDQPACMVLLDCGHGGACRHCSHLLFARPPHACPVCRRPIAAVVQLEGLPRVGEVVNTCVSTPAALK